MTFTELEIVLIVALVFLVYMYFDAVRLLRYNKHMTMQMIFAIADNKISVRRDSAGEIRMTAITKE